MLDSAAIWQTYTARTMAAKQRVYPPQKTGLFWQNAENPLIVLARFVERYSL